MAHLSLETTIAGGATVIALSGDLDIAGAALVERELARLGGAAGATLVIDLREVAFMDSSGLRVLALTARRVEDRGGRFALVAGAAQVMRVFDVTRMRERFTFVADPAELTGAP